MPGIEGGIKDIKGKRGKEGRSSLQKKEAGRKGGQKRPQKFWSYS